MFTSRFCESIKYLFSKNLENDCALCYYEFIIKKGSCIISQYMDKVLNFAIILKRRKW